MRLPDAIRRTFVAATCAVGLLLGTTVPAGAVPSDPVERYVVQVYEDLFDRVPDPGGLATWRNAIAGGMPRGAVANSITSSTEYRSKLVTGVYQRFLGRAPDDGGLRNWVGAMSGGWTVAQIEAGFLASDERYLQAGSTPQGWVTRLYQDVLGRTPASSEVDEWVRVMSQGLGRYQVSMGFLLSTEHLVTVVDGYYLDLLHRHIDPSGQQTWVGLLQRGERDENIIGGIISSAEYWFTATATPSVTVAAPAGTVRVGEPVSFAVTAYDGVQLRDVSAEATVTLSGGSGECRGNTCTPTVVGQRTVTASWHGASASIYVDIAPGTAASLVLTPSTAAVADGGSVVFSAAARDSLGNPVTDVLSSIVYAVDGDPAACTGSRCRPVGAGDHVVTASVAGSPAIAASATVRVAAAGPERFRAYEWGTATSVTQPVDGDGVQIGAASQWASISLGSSHTLAIKTDGTLWSWGKNFSGQLGDGTQEPLAHPEQVGTRTDWVAVAAGYSSSAAIAADGSLWVWGDLGSADGIFSRTATRPERVGADTDWASVALGDCFTLAIKRDGSLWSWGENEFGQLGDGTTARRTAPSRVGTGTWSSVAAGEAHALGIASDGTLWSWGLLVRGPLTTNNTVALVPGLVDPGTDWQSVAAGFDVSAAVRADGTLWTWGVSLFGQQLGDGAASRQTPGQVGLGTSWSAVTVGGTHMVGLDTAGGLWTWGDPDDEGPAPVQALPVSLGSATGWAAVSAGGGRTVALRP